MAQWKKTKIKLENGEIVEAQAPLIVSASRSTDIPAFYADWFFHRLEKGYSAWTNPFNGVKSYVSYDKTRFIVFWSKNPRPLLSYLHIMGNLANMDDIQAKHVINEMLDEKKQYAQFLFVSIAEVDGYIHPKETEIIDHLWIKKDSTGFSVS